MEAAWQPVHHMEPDGMQRRINPNAPQIVEIRTDVPAAWAGWSFSANGRHLISPERDRITPERLAGILWRDSMELRRAGLRSRREAEKPVRRGPVKVVVVDLADWHARHFGSRAG
ncbi:MAG: hypothetical protein MK141_08565 [Pseudoxanthomonas sp.]|uniref:hypothetical protein n=1 Tax=Pseudoxanthomonas sp. TaxID=1871049 RepID=UPI00258D1415|nr:hypothetical protein [Pseudoxanthomonas sp.]MCH2091610.1 hypothetical protein [Pseudoxanthomonas sp.]